MVSPNKLRLLYLQQILEEKSSEDFPLTSKQLMNELLRYDITVNRKSIYSDIETLREFGVDIVLQEGANPGYFVASREFEIAELKLLVDVVQSAKFITKKKSEILIKKISKLTNDYEAKNLNRDVIIFERPKADNETIYYSVDQIFSAISQDKQIQFLYREWTTKKTKRLRRGGAYYQVSPWALCWADENYYVIAYDHVAAVLKYYRVDKIVDISVIEAKRDGKKVFEELHIADLTKKTFAMFAGVEHKVTLKCKEDLVGVIIDRFGSDVPIRPVEEGYFHAHLFVSVSNQFFGWLTGLGSSAEIIEPALVKEEYKAFLKSILGLY